MTAGPVHRFALRFQISHFTLASLEIPVLMAAVPLGEREVADAPSRPTAGLPPGAQGYLLRGLPLAREQPALRRETGWLCYVVQAYDRCHIDLQQTFEQYKAKFSSKTRSTIVRKVRKWVEYTGEPLLWRSYQTEEELLQFHPLARAVSARTYQERLLDAGLPDEPAFIEGMRQAARLGHARGYILFHGQKPVSYLYCPIEDGVVIYAYLGFDPAYIKHSVGTVLQWQALEELFSERRFRFFDFTEGESEHKRLFATHVVPSANVLFVRSTVRNGAVLFAHKAFNGAVAGAAALAARWGVRDRLRRWQRFGRADAGRPA